MMPRIDGLEVTRRLCAAGGEVATLMLTARDEIKDRMEGLETGADDYLVKPFNFEELLARVHALPRRHTTPAGEREALPDAGVRMSVSSVEPAIVDGDRDRLRELIGILLDIAARYTPEGGRVTASLAIHDGRAVIVGGGYFKDLANAAPEDTGIDLDADDRAQLFERLYRRRRARELRPSGTDLGLAIANWIVESHGGTIGLLDRDGGGTIARVGLPMRER